MALIALPPELLEIIISHSLPESFEALALSCKAVFALCKAFVARHNQLNAQFARFEYRSRSSDVEHDIWTAFDLIARIAAEPIVARYIRLANFDSDSFRTIQHYPKHRDLPAEVDDVQYGGKVASLLSRSPYLQQAGLDKEEYWAGLKQQLTGIEKVCGSYSQHAAAFLLTLLPNVEYFNLPRMWRPIDSTNKLIDALVGKARHQHQPCNWSSLARTTDIRGVSNRSDLHWVYSLLALPQLQSITVVGSLTLGDMKLSSRRILGDTMKVATLRTCEIHEDGIAEFLKHTPNLTELTYSHSTGGRIYPAYRWQTSTYVPPNARDWNMCKFVAAIDCEAGDRLERLFISILDLRGSIVPGRAALRRFQRLRHLQFPFELAECNINSALTTGHNQNHLQGSLIHDLVPTTVQILSVPLSATCHNTGALDIWLSELVATKKSDSLPALKEIHFPYSEGSERTYNDRCTLLRTEIEKSGVVLFAGPDAHTNA